MMKQISLRTPFFCLLFACSLSIYLPASASFAASSEEEAQNSDEPNDTAKLPLPRFASLRSDEVNARVGPGTQYAIRWVYRRAGLPVEIIEQYEHWRKIRDPDGETSWLHKSMLVGKRTGVIKGETRMLLREPDAGTGIVVRAEPGVLAEIVACQTGWCRMQVNGRKGWLPKTQFFGAYPAEVFQ